jgi:hypothetical protein
MGLGVAGLAVLGLSMLFILFFMYFMKGSFANGGVEAMTQVSDSDRQQQLSALQSVRVQSSELAVVKTSP